MHYKNILLTVTLIAAYANSVHSTASLSDTGWFSSYVIAESTAQNYSCKVAFHHD